MWDEGGMRELRTSRVLVSTVCSLLGLGVYLFKKYERADPRTLVCLLFDYSEMA